jgi:hypothetical protein
VLIAAFSWVDRRAQNRPVIAEKDRLAMPYHPLWMPFYIMDQDDMKSSFLLYLIHNRLLSSVVDVARYP